MKMNVLKWEAKDGYWEARTEQDSGIYCTVNFLPTCNIRGPWRLVMEVPGWDEMDQPMRYYHSFDTAVLEASNIAFAYLLHSGKGVIVG